MATQIQYLAEWSNIGKYFRNWLLCPAFVPFFMGSVFPENHLPQPGFIDLCIGAPGELSCATLIYLGFFFSFVLLEMAFYRFKYFHSWRLEKEIYCVNKFVSN